jgi:uncharacterized integral membrane protein
MNRLAWIITLPIALLVILFALMNRQEVVLSLWPLPWEITAPLFILTLGGTVLGFGFGALAAWVSGGHTRQRLRAANRAVADSRDEIALLKRQQNGSGQTSASRPPAGQTLAHRPIPPVPGS